MKTNIKMRVTPEQSKRVQEICFKNNIAWHGVKAFNHLRQPYIYVYGNTLGYDCKESSEYFNDHENIEIDADLFIRTNGTCEENTFNELFEKVSKRVNDFQIGNRIEPLDKYAELENKLKKKNEILKKARIKRKNQREELHKLNLKLKDCVTREHFESHISSKNSVIKIIEDDRIFKYNMYQVALEEKTYKLNEAINKMDELRAMRFERDIEIEKLKTVIEYLESKVK